MKHIIIALIFFSFFSSKAQTLIKSIYNDKPCPQFDTNCYEKDINHYFDNFVGEWKFENDNTTIIFKLKKEIQYQLDVNSNYTDLLVGEFLYIKDNVEIINSLQDFDDINIEGYDHNISGGIFYHELPNNCIDNSPIQEKKVMLFINNPNDENIEGHIFLRYMIDNGIEKLQVCLRNKTYFADNEDITFDISNGYYEFIKQD
jgi:hypothetical protein